ncbi:MAG: hypothetical protein WKG32_03350, partial [Gemmatimonadaceae bacterium]
MPTVRERRGRVLRGLTGGAITLALASASVEAQQTSPAYQRALELEQADKYREAAAAYREALREAGGNLGALLGLERSYAQLGWSDSLLPILDSAIASRPGDATLRTMQLRTLRGGGDPSRVRGAFERWRRDAGRDIAPYREYAKLLLQDGHTAGADSVLRRAQEEFGSGRGLELEVAQLRAAMGLWEPAAEAWRAAIEAQPYLEQAAVFALAPTPTASRG